MCGLVTEADGGLPLAGRRQLPDGSWFNYYRGDGVKDPRLDTNVCAYLAAGAWHHHLITGDVEFLGELWPTHRGRRSTSSCAGSSPTARSCGRSTRPAGPRPMRSSPGRRRSTTRLRCAVAVAECLAKDRPDWELAAGRLGHAVAHHPGAFAPKVEFAMDWYYPMLSGALEGEAGRRRASRRDGRPSSWRVSGCAASRRATGSPRPRRPSAS